MVFKLKSKEQQIGELNRDLIYWNSKMCMSTCSNEIARANEMIKHIQTEFEKLKSKENIN